MCVPCTISEIKISVVEVEKCLFCIQTIFYAVIPELSVVDDDIGDAAVAVTLPQRYTYILHTYS